MMSYKIMARTKNKTRKKTRKFNDDFYNKKLLLYYI